MADLLWAVLCYKANVDRDTNNVSLFDIIEEITLGAGQELKEDAEMIAMAHHMELATLWRRTAKEVPELGQMRLRIISPSNNITGEAELAIRLDTSLRYRGIVKLDVLPFGGFGTYYFQVSKKEESDWLEVAKIPLELSRAPSAEKGKIEPPRRSGRTARKTKR